MTSLQCHYCQSHGKKSAATFTVHDSRGCVHVCHAHVKWRLTTSTMFGHSSNCPYSGVPTTTLSPRERAEKQKEGYDGAELR